jgi:cell division protein FtsN
MKNLLIFIIIINLSACSYFYNSNSGQTNIRIVDSNGKPKNLRTFTPELNIRYLAEQKMSAFTSTNIPTNNTPNQTPISNIENNLIPQNNAPIVKNNLGKSDNIQPTFDESIKNNEKTKIQTQKVQTKKEDAPIIYNLSNSDVKKPNTIKKQKKPKPAKITKSSKIKKGDLLIQIASFRDKRKAITAQKKENIKNSRILSVKIGRKTYHKLLVGPFKNKNNASKQLKILKNKGHKDAFYYRFK